MKKMPRINTFLNHKIKKVKQGHFRLLLAGLLTFSIFACDDEKKLLDSQNQSSPSSSRVDGDIDKLYDERSNLQREFSKSLAKSLSQSKMLRDIIRTKALEMFDEDYELLYEMIKDDKVENNLTVEELITKNITDKKELKKLDTEYPTLTILVPTLPKDCFNPQKWNTATEIPKVAVRLHSTNDVPIIDGDGSEKLMEGKYTPGFPVIVVKENERLVSDKHKDFRNYKTKEFTSNRGVRFKFFSEEFDRKANKLKNKSGRIGFNHPSSIDPFIISAYNNYKNVSGWHRDQIYYNITPTQTNGEFSYDFKDGLRSFKMIGNPTVAYNQLADQTDDPRINNVTSGSHWTGGSFEFRVSCLINAKNGIGSELITGFGAAPDELFELNYDAVYVPLFGTIYLLNNIQLKQKELNIPILNWNLNEYAKTIKISIEEVDIQTTTVVSESSSVKFAANFGLDGGILKKIGLKLGGSVETTQTQTYQKTFTQGNNDLGSVSVDFADDVVIGEGVFIFGLPIYSTREYNTGWYSISFEPIRVQGF